MTYTHQGNELSIQILNTKVILRENDVLINGNIRHTLPYQIDNIIIRRASTVFIEVRGEFKFLKNFDLVFSL